MRSRRWVTKAIAGHAFGRRSQSRSLRQVLRVRVRSLRAFEEQPSLSERMNAIMSGWEVRARRMGTA
jgi:hypothetical protein